MGIGNFKQSQNYSNSQAEVYEYNAGEFQNCDEGIIQDEEIIKEEEYTKERKIENEARDDKYDLIVSETDIDQIDNEIIEKFNKRELSETSELEGTLEAIQKETEDSWSMIIDGKTFWTPTDVLVQNQIDDEALNHKVKIILSKSEIAVAVEVIQAGARPIS